MINEYAVEPNVMSTWTDFRFIFDRFGIEHGRLISKYPKKWKRFVYDESHGCGDIERKKIEERLAQIDIKLFDQSRPYDGTKPWLQNAENNHHSNPFRAIVATQNPRNQYHILQPDDLDDGCVLWHVAREKRIQRTAAALAACAAPIISQSQEILFVDPHFGPELPRYCATFNEFLRVIHSVCLFPIRIEYHLKEKSNYAFFSSECSRRLPPLLTRGVEVRFVRWREKTNGEKFHARYLLTEKAGIRFETGLDEGGIGETTDVTLLDVGLHQQCWNQYQDAFSTNLTGSFEYVDEVIVIGTA